MTSARPECAADSGSAPQAAPSGLAEVTAVIADALEQPLRPLLSFSRGPGAVDEIAGKLSAWLELDERRRRRAAAELSGIARRRFGWESVAQSVIAAAQGRPEELPEPPARAEASGHPSG